MWPLLARLAGREPDAQPGAGFAPPTAWRLPPSWLAPFADALPWTWRATARRLQVHHPAGFMVVDVPRGSEPVHEQLAAEMERYGVDRQVSLVHDARRQASFAGHPLLSGKLRRWFGWLTPYVAARLGRGLGVREQAALAGLLAAQPARVEVTAAQVDVIFALAELPIAVRLAGLDRNPGWVPAAGRAISFHFE